MRNTNGSLSNAARRGTFRAEHDPFRPGMRLDQLGQTLAAAYDELLAEPVPDHIARLVRSMRSDAVKPVAAGARLALVVEDDHEVRALAETVLEETPLEVIGCDTAEHALSVLHDLGGQVVLVFADARLPGAMDGVQLARAVATLWPRARVIVTSGSALEHADAMPDRARFMAKPWRPLDVLVEAERAAVDTPAAVL